MTGRKRSARDAQIDRIACGNPEAKAVCETLESHYAKIRDVLVELKGASAELDPVALLEKQGIRGAMLVRLFNEVAESNPDIMVKLIANNALSPYVANIEHEDELRVKYLARCELPAPPQQTIQVSGFAATVEILQFRPSDWARMGKELMILEEKCFEGDLRLSAKDKRGAVSEKGAIVLLAKADGRVIGEAYGMPLSSMREAGDPKDEEQAAFKALNERHMGKEAKVFYNYSIAVLPEYQDKGIGTALKKALIAKAREAGFEFFVDHARKGPSVHIDQKMGATVVEEYPNWYGAGKSHYLCEIKLVS